MSDESKWNGLLKCRVNYKKRRGDPMVKIIADSTCDLSAELIAKYDKEKEVKKE